MKPKTAATRPSFWLITSAIVVFICGVLAIVLPVAFSVGIAALLGWLFLLAGLAHLVFGINVPSGGWWHFSIAGLYGIAAIILVVNPLLGVVVLALMVGVVLIAEAIIEMVIFILLRGQRHAGWILFDAIMTLAIGIFVCAQWPPETPEIIPYMVGIGFISSGISRFMLGLAARNLAPATF
jgi:uncharacterized membrane protein HdeD (DUF308 family)